MTRRTEARPSRAQDGARAITMTTLGLSSRGSTDVSCTAPYRSPWTAASVDCTGSTSEPSGVTVSVPYA